MQSEHSITELRKAIKEIELLIEDNNQNIKDCVSILREIKPFVFPEKKSILSKILNILKSLYMK